MTITKKLRRFFKKPNKKTLILYARIGIPLVLLFGIFYYFILRDLPSPTKLVSGSLPQSTQIYDRNGNLLYSIFEKKNQIFIPLTSIPKTVQQATIAIEDKDFYRHGPIDLRGIARAFYVTVFHKQVQGGSTITQQLVKNSLLSPEQTILRKIREIVLSFATEVLYPKNRILELYLNQIPYGGTAYGIEAASLSYFGKHAKDLDIAQSALLAGLPEAPTTYSPFGPHPELAKQRQKDVLFAMKDQGYITSSQYQKAVEEPLTYNNVSDNIKAPHFVLYIKDLLEKKYGQAVVAAGGLKVKTSLDLSIQNFAQDTVASEVAKLDGYHVTNGAAVITNPGSGEILAMVGSRDYFDTTDTDGNVNITLQHRQPGSSIKPINYAEGLIKGYTAATPFADQPICFPNPSGPAYCPVNYDGKFHGVVDMRQSLGNSFNIPAVKMLKANGVENMLTLARQMGISSLSSNADQYGLSLTLGGGEVTMLDMTTAFGVFANGGYRIDLHPILEIKNSKGEVLESYTPPQSPIFGKKVLPDGVAFIISDILADNGARLQEFGGSSELYFPKNYVSAKTGTTNDFRDNWTIGYTPNYVVTVWVGNNDNSRMNGLASGITGAAPIFHKIMLQLLDDKPAQQPQRPANVVQAAVCSTTGLFPNSPGQNSCPVRNEYFLAGTQNKTSASVTQEKMWIDKTTNRPPAPGQTDNIELRDETTLTDLTGDKYCLTCPPPAESPTPTPKP
ncbi:MAG TPA: transglycosylase domain-containing protein [Candidatus Eisenbacteria bacterium]|nr:transglycosylase domain-containing protein [Candidatus Eisenbacteria bacterium]